MSGFAPLLPTLDVEQRDIQKNQEGATARVCAWLGLDIGLRLEFNYIMGAPDDLAIAVPNLDELRSAVRASPLADLEPMFDD